MKYQVLGPRILIEVKKLHKQETFKDSKILMPEELREQEHTAQTIGVVKQIGNTAYKNIYDGSQEDKWCNEGDTVHFQRYGAVRLASKKEEDKEYWIVNDRDLLCIERENNAN